MSGGRLRRGARAALALCVVGLVGSLGLVACAPTSPAPSSSSAASRTPSPAPAQTTTDPGADGSELPLVAGVSPDRRHLVDQHGEPLLLQAETVWSVMQSLTLEEVREHLDLRARQGFNAILLSPYPWIGRDDDPGRTVDGLVPFDGDVAVLDEAYWSRVDEVFAEARARGITVVVAPSGVPTEFEAQGYTYDADVAAGLGQALGERYRDVPGLVWLMGVDYDPELWDEDDPMMLAFVDGLRRGGDTHLVTVQLFSPSSSWDNPRWRRVNQVEATYTYRPTYAAVLEAYSHGTGPVVLIEANFEHENNEGGPPTTDETLRRQTWWTLTSGGVGVTYGELHLWRFTPGWQDARETRAVDQLGAATELVAGLRWWDLVPDADGTFLTAGRGDDPTRGTQEGGFPDVLESDRATAALAADGSLALVYVPTARKVTVDLTRLAPGAQASWVDPTTGEATAVDLTGTWTTPGENAAGDEDWVLLITTEAG